MSEEVTTSSPKIMETVGMLSTGPLDFIANADEGLIVDPLVDDKVQLNIEETYMLINLLLDWRDKRDER